MATQRLLRPTPTTVLATVAAGSLLVGLSSRFLSSAPLHAESPAMPATAAPPKRAFGSGPAFLSLALESSEQVNHNTKLLRFKLPDAEAVSGLPLTSALLTISWPKGSFLPVPRPYTPISSPDDKGHIDLLVKQYPSGRASTHLHALTPGQTLLFAMPIPGPKWPSPSAPKAVTLIAGGAGITPIYQLAHGILTSGGPADDKTTVTLVYGANGDDDVLLRDRFDALEERFRGRFRAVYTVSKPGPESANRRGYVDAALLREVGASPEAEGGSSAVYVCGPPAMEKALLGERSKPGVLQQLGYRKDQIHQF